MKAKYKEVLIKETFNWFQRTRKTTGIETIIKTISFEGYLIRIQKLLCRSAIYKIPQVRNVYK